MNKRDKQRLQTEMALLALGIKEKSEALLLLVENAIDNENEKLENIPESFSSSSIVNDITEIIEALESCQESSNEVINNIDDIVSSFELDMQNIKPLASRKTSVELLQEPRSSNILIKISPILHGALKKEALNQNISVNGLINNAIFKEIM